jgi:uncharacterized membrane protein
LIGLLLGLLPSNDPLSAEVLARTAPSLLDLGVALFAGLAGAYAICESEAAGALPGVAIAAALVPPLSSVGLAWAVGDWQAGFGALLLFTTNFVTVGTAAALVFVLHGFRPNPGEKERLRVQVRTARLALVALTLVAAALAATTYLLAEQTSRESRITQIASNNLDELLGDSADHDITITGNLNDLSSGLLLEVTLRAATEPSLSTVRQLQDEIVVDLRDEIGFSGELALEMTYIQVKRLDPLNAPAEPAPTP